MNKPFRIKVSVHDDRGVAFPGHQLDFMNLAFYLDGVFVDSSQVSKIEMKKIRPDVFEATVNVLGEFFISASVSSSNIGDGKVDIGDGKVVSKAKSTSAKSVSKAKSTSRKHKSGTILSEPRILHIFEKMKLLPRDPSTITTPRILYLVPGASLSLTVRGGPPSVPVAYSPDQHSLQVTRRKDFPKLVFENSNPSLLSVSVDSGRVFAKERFGSTSGDALVTVSAFGVGLIDLEGLTEDVTIGEVKYASAQLLIRVRPLCGLAIVPATGLHSVFLGATSRLDAKGKWIIMTRFTLISLTQT